MRDPWDITPADYPVSGRVEDKLRFWLRYAVLAPSAHNTQPWRYEVTDKGISLYRDEAHTLKDSDPTGRETFLGLGAFIENFVVAAESWGASTIVDIKADTVADLHIADIEVSLSISSNHQATPLFSGITKRHTNRGMYKQDTDYVNYLSQLPALALPDTAYYCIQETEARTRIAQLVGKATGIALAMRKMRAELSPLLFTQVAQQTTGMEIAALVENPGEVTNAATWVHGSLDPLKEAAYWETAFRTTPLHIVVATKYDYPQSWIAAGRVLERALLLAGAEDMTHCIAAGPIEIPTVLPGLRQEIQSDYRPQALFRVGIPMNIAFTKMSPRRPVD